MPISEAALDGIRDNGLRWRFHIGFSSETERMGEMDFDTDDSEVERCARAIVAQGRNFTKRVGLDEHMVSAINRNLDALEDVADCGLEEVRYAMSSLYDQFDYWRICVVS